MNHEVPFDSVESAHEFVTLLAQTVVETKRDIAADIQREMGANFPRRRRALQIIEDKLRTLESDLKNSRRILNSLRSLRRLLMGERTNGGVAIGVAKAEISPAVACYASIWETARKQALSSLRDAQAQNPGVADAVPWYVRQDTRPLDGTTGKPPK